MDVGLTATRRGMIGAQFWELRRWLIWLRDEHGAATLHHGDCIGGDVEGAVIANELGYRTVAYPGHPEGAPRDDRFRAYHHSSEIREPAEYKARDREIVSACQVLIGCPDSSVERLRSGTWYTIRQARVRPRALLVIGPRGDVLEQRGLDLLGGAA